MTEHLRATAKAPLREFPLDASVSAYAGRPLALIGPSGAGKTNLLRVIAGLLAPVSGRVSVGDEVWLDTEAAVDVPAERRRCGLVFQDYALFERMSVWRNVAYGVGADRRARRGEAMAMLERFGLGALADARPGSLSGGERQRVALARSLAARPRVLLLDEPLAALDSSTRRAALGELRGVLSGLRAPVVLVTHSFDEAAEAADSIAVMDRGTVVQTGTAAEVSAHPCSPFVAEFSGAAVLRGIATGGDAGTLVRLPGGGEVSSPDRCVGRGEVAISVFPWEVELEDVPSQAHHPPRNRLAGEVTSMVGLGNRARVGIATPQRLDAEVSADWAARAGLRPGRQVVASWPVERTRVIPLGDRP